MIRVTKSPRWLAEAVCDRSDCTWKGYIFHSEYRAQAEDQARDSMLEHLTTAHPTVTEVVESA